MDNTKLKEPDSYINIASEVLGKVPSLAKSEKIRLRRTMGLSVDELKVDDRILFYSLFPSDDNYVVPSDKYLLNSILFGVQVACSQDASLESEIKLQELVAIAYRDAKSNTSKLRIEAFMASEGRGNYMFFKDLSWITSGLIKRNHVNIFALTADLIRWDFGGRDRWLNSIIRIKQNEFFDE